MFTIRGAEDADIPAMVELIREAFAEYSGRLDPPSSAERKSAELVRQELRDGGAFLAVSGESIVGCVFYHLYADHVYLDRLSVLPGYRRYGIGRALVEQVEQLAAARGLAELRLSVRLALLENRAYYERLGYSLLSYGTHAGYSAPTYVTLQKRLAPAGLESLERHATTDQC